MGYNVATKLTDKETGEVFVITDSSSGVVKFTNGKHSGEVLEVVLEDRFNIEPNEEYFGQKDVLFEARKFKRFLSTEQYYGVLRQLVFNIIQGELGETRTADLTNAGYVMDEIHSLGVKK
jgi:hypothetical protein